MSREELITMSKLSRDGGFAFPTSLDSSIGMSLRDYFAAAALPVCIELAFKSQKDPIEPIGNIMDRAAAWAEFAADAMLRRKKQDAMLEARKEGGDA